MKKLVVYIDMDDVLADFSGAISGEMDEKGKPVEMKQKGFYRNLKPVKGAIETLDRLLANPALDIYIATKPTTSNFHSATEKYEWVNEHLPKLIKKIFLTCDKTKLIGDVLIDDFDRWSKFKGTFFLFDKNHPEKSWKEIENILTLCTT